MRKKDLDAVLQLFYDSVHVVCVRLHKRAAFRVGGRQSEPRGGERFAFKK